MRIIENGMNVKMIETKYETKAVDTKEDLDIVIETMKNDKLFIEYNFKKV